MVNYMNWQPGEPNAGVYTGNEARNTGGTSGDEDAVEIDLRPGYDGKWNDDIETGSYGGRMTGMYPICETQNFVRTDTMEYVGCFKDEGDKDGDGTIDCTQEGQDGNSVGQAAHCRDLNDQSFVMGTESSKLICAELCAGYVYFALQYGNWCFCDNTPTAEERAPESECDMPCYDGTNDDGTPKPRDGGEMCGGAWRNSVYKASTTFWENAGFDDNDWPAAADLGPNGVAPWFKRQQIDMKAHWIWTTDPGHNDAYQGAINTFNHNSNDGGSGLFHQGYDEAGTVSGSSEGHGNVFCRYNNPNREISCPAAQAKYWEMHPDVKTAEYPAFLHYMEFGKNEGRTWPSDLCNTCSEKTSKENERAPQGNAGVSTNCDASVFGNKVGDCFERPGVTGDNRNSVGEYNGQGSGGAMNQYTNGRTQGSEGGVYTYEEGLQCTDKCRGMHDAAVATLSGAQSCHENGDVCHGGHYGLGFANFMVRSQCRRVLGNVMRDPILTKLRRLHCI
jgi:hypothetical protein